jgi:hypothetical protein
MLFAFAMLAAQGPAPDRFSILAPVPPQECREDRVDDVVVCGKTPALSQRLPLPDERVPTGPVASNPNVTGIGAMRSEAVVCAAIQRGCVVGVGPPPAAVEALVNLVEDAVRRKPDKRGRVPID